MFPLVDFISRDLSSVYIKVQFHEGGYIGLDLTLAYWLLIIKEKVLNRPHNFRCNNPIKSANGKFQRKRQRQIMHILLCML